MWALMIYLARRCKWRLDQAWNRQGTRLSYRLITVFMSAVLSSLLVSCSAAPIKVVQRLPSPDGLVDALLVVRPTASIAETVYELYIVPHRGNPRSQDLILRGSLFSQVRIVWRKSRWLDLCYASAYILEFKNYWQSPDVQNLEYMVEIRLMPPADKLGLPQYPPD
jgi:hypothetical protein